MGCLYCLEPWVIIVVIDLIAAGILVTIVTYTEYLRESIGLGILSVLNALIIFLAFFTSLWLILIGVVFLILECAVIKSRDIE